MAVNAHQRQASASRRTAAHKLSATGYDETVKLRMRSQQTALPRVRAKGVGRPHGDHTPCIGQMIRTLAGHGVGATTEQDIHLLPRPGSNGSQVQILSSDGRKLADAGLRPRS